MPKGWSATRKAKLQAQPICEHPGCTYLAVTVDHILARAFGGGEEPANLQSLCKTHARAKDAADREAGKRRKGMGGRKLR